MKHRMKPAYSDERGMALISALLLIMIVSLMAVGISSDTSMDVRIAGYQKFKAISFGYAESGSNTATEILEENIFDTGWSGTPPFSYPHLSASYNGTVTIYDGDFCLNANAANNTVIEMTGDIVADIIIQRLLSMLATGGAIQQAAGYEGLGKGAGGGGVHVIYNFETRGQGSESAETLVGQHYRYVTN
ncbi:MAG: pilus assembly PilX N-terminal domain-containing protein [Desulfobulbaceae bacterium]|nr:pilus assembly PilX N-terminal domain-containing protein [Desulfobulbaceae bacterium]